MSGGMDAGRTVQNPVAGPMEAVIPGSKLRTVEGQFVD